MKLGLPLAVLAVSAALAAQTQITSPAGLLTTEGSSNHTYMLFAKPEMRWQQIDGTNRQTMIPIRNIGWRRDFGAAVNTAYAARTMDNFEIWLANGDTVTCQVTNLDLNYVSAATQVLGPKKISVPDWSQKPASSPDAWSILLPLDKPWLYGGQHDLLWEVRMTANTGGGTDYPFDFQSVSVPANTSNSGLVLGTGCLATGQTVPAALLSTIHNHGTKFRLETSATNLAPSTTAFLNIDAVQQNLMLPSLCATLYALPMIYLSYPTSAAGATGTQVLDNIPYSAVLVGVDLFTQAWTIDMGQPGLPIALTNCRKLTVPSDPSRYQVKRFYHYKNVNQTNLITSGPWTGGIVTLLSV